MSEISQRRGGTRGASGSAKRQRSTGQGKRARAKGGRRHGGPAAKGNSADGSGRGVSSLVILLLLVAAGLFAALGRWQLERAQEQHLLNTGRSAAKEMAELNLGDVSVTDKDVFRRASAEGIYDSTQQFYLEGRRQGDQIGYHVITALRLVGTRRYVLVNRGWMPGHETAARVPAGKVQVSGVLAKAQLPGLLLGEPRGTTRPYLDPKAYAAESGRAVEPLMLVASGDSTSLVPVTTERGMKEASHRAYAFQWFTFAVLTVGAAGLMGWRRMGHGR